MTEVNRRYFESLMQAKKLSLRGLAKSMGMSHSQLSLTFSGDRKLQLDEASQLSTILGEPLHRIVENAGVTVAPTGLARVSVIGAMGGDGIVALHAEGVIERTGAPRGIAADGVAVQCRTVGTALDWMDSWIFFCPKLDGVDSAILARFALCQLADGPAVMASVRRGYQEATFNLRGPFSQDNVKLTSATPVLFTRN